MLVGEKAGATPLRTRRQCVESVSAEKSVRCPVNDISRSDRSGSRPLFSACTRSLRVTHTQGKQTTAASAGHAGKMR